MSLDKQDRKASSDALLFPTVLIGIIIIFDWLLRASVISPSFLFYDLIDEIIDGIRDNHILLRSLFIILVLFSGISNKKRSLNKVNIIRISFFALISSFGFMYGFSSYLYWNLLGYPISFFLMSIFLPRTIYYLQSINKKELKTGIEGINKGKENLTNFSIPTDKGSMLLPLPTNGTYIEGAAGSGKSVFIEWMIYQAVKKNFSLFLYDFEGNYNEGGALLTRCVLGSLKKYKKKKKLSTNFAFLNFNDPSRTVRCNPLSPKYIKSELDISEFVTTLMTNLNPDWKKKRDFWADNAINYANGIVLRLWRDESLHKFMTIPHLVSICTKDYELVFKWILSSKETDLERQIMPLYVAYKSGASSQIAGAVSSAALPITKLFTKNIFWPLSPLQDEEFSLDITNKKNPICFCVGMVPNQKFSLGPVVSLIALVCMNNMNQLDKHKSLFILDELATITIPNIEFLPATARKKGVCSIFAVQSFKQLEESYGKDAAEIIRDNLSNQFIFKTNSLGTAKRIVDIFGKSEKKEYSETDGDSYSQTLNIREKNVIQPRDIITQQPGHCTGIIAGGDPALFHTQLDYFEIDKPDIPAFSSSINTGSVEQDSEIMNDKVKANFDRINQEIDDMFANF